MQDAIEVKPQTNLAIPESAIANNAADVQKGREFVRDVFEGDVRARFGTAMDALGSAVALQQAALDRVRATLNGSRVAIEVSALEAAQRVNPTGAPVGPSTYARRQQDAANAHVAGLESQVVERVRSEFASKASETATLARAAMDQAKSALLREELRSASPLTALRSRTLEAIIAQDQLQGELRALGPRGFLSEYRASLAVDPERAAALETAGWPVLQGLVTAPPPKRNPAMNSEPWNDGDRLLAIEALGLIQSERAKRIPAWIRAAREFHDSFALPLYRRVVGITAWDLSADEFAATFIDGDRPTDPLRIHPGFVVRGFTLAEQTRKPSMSGVRLSPGASQ